MSPAHRRYLLVEQGIGAAVFNFALNAGIVSFGAGMGLFALVGVPMALTAWRRSRVRVMLPDGRIVSVKHQTPTGAELEPDGEDSWSLRLTAEGNVSRATGTVATHGLRGLLTTVNFFGARTGEIDNAIGMLQQSGDANRYIAKVARAAQSTGTANVNFMPPEVRLALEMALHEAGERQALAGELAELRQEWQLAEDIAATAKEKGIRAFASTYRGMPVHYPTLVPMAYFNPERNRRVLSIGVCQIAGVRNDLI